MMWVCPGVPILLDVPEIPPDRMPEPAQLTPFKNPYEQSNFTWNKERCDHYRAMYNQLVKVSVQGLAPLLGSSVIWLSNQ